MIAITSILGGGGSVVMIRTAGHPEYEQIFVASLTAVAVALIASTILGALEISLSRSRDMENRLVRRMDRLAEGEEQIVLAFRNDLHKGR